MILVAGLSPAWQQIMRFDGLCAGEVNRAVDVHWCASGKVLNVAVALAHLGAPCETVAPVGGAAGERIRREFESWGIPAAWVETQAPTRICTTLIDRRSGQATELVENAAPVSAAEARQFLASYSERAAHARLAILTGSLPAGVPPTFFRDLLLATPCAAILDVRGPELLAALEQRPLVVKPNRAELAYTLRRDLDSDAKLRDAMRELHDRGARWIIVTDGAWPAWASGEGSLFRVTPPAVAVVNPIASGDCLAAGLAWALLHGQQQPEAIRLAVAAAVENTTQLLPARLDPDLVRARAGSVQIESMP